MGASGWAGEALRQEPSQLFLELPSFVSSSFLPSPLFTHAPGPASALSSSHPQPALAPLLYLVAEVSGTWPVELRAH